MTLSPAVLRKNEVWIPKFKDRFKGETLTIIGNGPSILRHDLSKINTTTMGVNLVNLSTGFTPGLVVAIDNMTYRRVDFWGGNSHYFIPKDPDLEDIERIRNNRHFSTFPRAASWDTNKEGFVFSHDVTLTGAHAYCSLFVAVEVATFIGFRNFILVGFDLGDVYGFPEKHAVGRKTFYKDTEAYQREIIGWMVGYLKEYATFLDTSPGHRIRCMPWRKYEEVFP